MNKEDLEKKIFSLKIQIETITANIEQFKKIREDMAQRLFDTKQELFALHAKDGK